MNADGEKGKRRKGKRKCALLLPLTFDVSSVSLLD
jgi:hypothetical protein